ncbi:hypothetical protein HMN09_01203000 [Mycena chlorophos]|uniref:Uncharacterized protein n=1 Tax=Mycena chlorophos TaxID=658473 RepID=A0A8H6S5P6_MYCCL|nr:hypothetical protein HMN09_01203000 [Mycena chlorophos]
MASRLPIERWSNAGSSSCSTLTRTGVVVPAAGAQPVEWIPSPASRQLEGVDFGSDLSSISSDNVEPTEITAAAKRNASRLKPVPGRAKSTKPHYSYLLKDENARLQTEVTTLRDHNQELQATVRDLQCIIEERNAAKNANIDPDLEVYFLKTDDCTVTDAKDMTERLNYQLDQFCFGLLDSGKRIAESSAAFPEAHTPVPEGFVIYPDCNSRLYRALYAFRRRPQYRGIIIDAITHHLIVSQLGELYFSDMLPATIDPQNLLGKLSACGSSDAAGWSENMAKQTNHVVEDSKVKIGRTLMEIFAIAYELPVDTFAPLNEPLLTSLSVLYTSASELALAIRRDVVTVRLSVAFPRRSPTFGSFPTFDHDEMVAHRGGRERLDGEELVGLYHIGLRKQTENGETTFVIKPAVFLRQSWS